MIDGLSQADAIKLLYKAVIPELRGEVLTGEDGAPLIEPTRRDELYSSMELARRTAFMLRAGDDAQRELAALDAPGIDTNLQLIPEPEPETATEAPEPPTEPTEPPLPAHAFIYIEEGARERSGERAWLAMEGQGQILNTFHGADARQKARDWIGTKFGASPAEEIEIPLPEGETNKFCKQTGRVGRQ